MGRFFNLDSPVMVALTKMADLIIVNLLAFFCCLPIITVGASMTALHYVVLKIVRDEECYIVKGFFKSFKDNFKQATIINKLVEDWHNKKALEQEKLKELIGHTQKQVFFGAMLGIALGLIFS